MTLQKLISAMPRKQQLRWMESRLRRLRCIKVPTDQQKKRIRELELFIAVLQP